MTLANFSAETFSMWSTDGVRKCESIGMFVYALVFDLHYVFFVEIVAYCTHSLTKSSKQDNACGCKKIAMLYLSSHAQCRHSK
jgi:hypothetical protein